MDGVVSIAGKLMFRQLVYTPAQIVEASAPSVAGKASQYGGIYFLIWKRQIVYVGKASTLWARLNAHYREGRPHDAVAVIAGLPIDRAAALENCYVRAWSPPWNCQPTSGRNRRSALVQRWLEGMDRSQIMPWYVPTGGAEMMLMKKWQQHVMGYRQAHA